MVTGMWLRVGNQQLGLQTRKPKPQQKHWTGRCFFDAQVRQSRWTTHPQTHDPRPSPSEIRMVHVYACTRVCVCPRTHPDSASPVPWLSNHNAHTPQECADADVHSCFVFRSVVSICSSELCRLTVDLPAGHHDREWDRAPHLWIRVWPRLGCCLLQPRSRHLYVSRRRCQGRN